MDSAATNAFTGETRLAMFYEFDIDPSKVEDLGGFESFVFLRPDRNSVLRITHLSHRTFDEVKGEVAWIEFLAAREACVCRPIPLRGKELAVQFQDFILCEFERAPGRTIVQEDWNTSLFSIWGENIGLLHRLTLNYAPPVETIKRIDWQCDPNFDFVSRIPTSESDVLERGRQYHEALLLLPVTENNFGLIHCDAHPGNFNFLKQNQSEQGKITFFDFDDCCYCWFGYDIATILFGAVLQPWIEDSETARVEAASKFMPAFLDGYAKQKSPDELVMSQMQTFLKVRELSLYGVIRTFIADMSDNAYAERFMRGRRARIENDVPYLDIDFPSRF